MSFVINPLWKPPEKWCVVGKPTPPSARPHLVAQRLADLIKSAKERRGTVVAFRK